MASKYTHFRYVGFLIWQTVLAIVAPVLLEISLPEVADMNGSTLFYSVAGGLLAGFTVGYFKQWPAGTMVWVLPTAWFSLRFLLAVPRSSASVMEGQNRLLATLQRFFYPQIEAAGQSGDIIWYMMPFIIATIPFLRCATYSIGIYVARRIKPLNLTDPAS